MLARVPPSATHTPHQGLGAKVCRRRNKLRVDLSMHKARVMLAYVSDVPCCRFGHNASAPSIIYMYIYVYTYIYVKWTEDSHCAQICNMARRIRRQASPGLCALRGRLAFWFRLLQTFTPGGGVCCRGRRMCEHTCPVVLSSSKSIPKQGTSSDDHVDDELTPEDAKATCP